MSAADLLGGWVLNVIDEGAEQPGVSITASPLPEFVVCSMRTFGLEPSGNELYVLIGRAEDCHVRPSKLEVSRHHCAVVIRDSGPLLLDLKSRNGCWHNGSEVASGQGKLLADGDVFGPPLCKFVLRRIAASNVSESVTQVTEDFVPT